MLRIHPSLSQVNFASRRRLDPHQKLMREMSRYIPQDGTVGPSHVAGFITKEGDVIVASGESPDAMNQAIKAELQNAEIGRLREENEHYQQIIQDLSQPQDRRRGH